MKNWVRRTHRWLTPVFTLAVVANSALLCMGQRPPDGTIYAPLLPLLLMMLTGLYMFVLPHRSRRTA